MLPETTPGQHSGQIRVLAPFTFYQFQLVKDPSEYAAELLCPPPPWPGYSACAGTRSNSALPIGWVCGNCETMFEVWPVHLDLASAGVTLTPGTTYHYRVIAARSVEAEDMIEWEPPTVFGADQTFTTPSEPGVEPLTEPNGGTDPHSSTATQPPPSASPPHHRRHHRHHRRHKRALHRGSLGRASIAG